MVVQFVTAKGVGKTDHQNQPTLSSLGHISCEDETHHKAPLTLWPLTSTVVSSFLSQQGPLFGRHESNIFRLQEGYTLHGSHRGALRQIDVQKV